MSHRWNRPICTPGLLLGAKTCSFVLNDWLVFLMESNIPPFFEHNMRFLSYSAALCIQMNRFQSEGQA